MAMDQIDEFFAGYPDFDYNRTESSPKEFHRMCKFFGWEKDIVTNEYPRERNEAYEAFRHAVTRTFNNQFGVDEHSRAPWETLCTILGIDPIPNTVEQMKKKVKSTHVNLSDLLDRGRTGAELEIFGSQQELAVYTISTGRFFPKDEAYAGGVLRFLLREIVGSYQGRGRGAQGAFRGGRRRGSRTIG